MCDLPYPEFLTEKVVIARKQHRCSECGGAILKGESYHYFAGFWSDGHGFGVYKRDKQCEAIYKAMCKKYPHDRDCFGFGNLLGQIHQLDDGIMEARFKSNRKKRLFTASNA